MRTRNQNKKTENKYTANTAKIISKPTVLCSCQNDRGKQMEPELKEINIPKGSCYWDICAENLLPVSTSHLLVLPKGSFCSTTATSSPSCKSISNSCAAWHLRFAWYRDSVLYVDNSLDLSPSVWRGDSS